ncbi:MAG: cation transporter [bacterium]|nr:cation transporter [bacterium]
MKKPSSQLYQLAFGLAVFTVVYNIAEGLVATLLGYADESLTLFGFGIDSFIETISGLGILHMVIRIKANPESSPDVFERKALKITGWSFYFLVAGLVVSSSYNIVTDQRPDPSLYGIIISLISIAIMVILLKQKTNVGRDLNSQAILADAECTRVCIYMSLVLLASSGLYYFTKLPYLDSIGAILLAYFSFQEGRECFEKAASESVIDHHHH